MEKNIGAEELTPRIVMALGAVAASLWLSNTILKAGLLALAAGMLTTVATEYCPVNALANRDTSERPTWRTIKTWRVEASPIKPLRSRP